MNELTIRLATKAQKDLTETQRKFERLLAWHKIAKKAHARWLETMNKISSYAACSERGEIWTILESREELMTQATAHIKAYLYCLEKTIKIKSEL